jgi:hypothetical protein
MFTLDFDRFMIELKEGTLEHVGASNKSATAKLYDVEVVDIRTFGGERVKITFEDDGGNEVEVALDPPKAREIASEIESLEAESDTFE